MLSIVRFNRYAAGTVYIRLTLMQPEPYIYV